VAQRTEHVRRATCFQKSNASPTLCRQNGLRTSSEILHPLLLSVRTKDGPPPTTNIKLLGTYGTKPLPDVQGLNASVLKYFTCFLIIQLSIEPWPPQEPNSPCPLPPLHPRIEEKVCRKLPTLPLPQSAAGGAVMDSTFVFCPFLPGPDGNVESPPTPFRGPHGLCMRLETSRFPRVEKSKDPKGLKQRKPMIPPPSP